MTSVDQDKSKNKNSLHIRSKFFSHEGEVVWSIEDFAKFKNIELVSSEFSIVPSCEKKWEIIIEIKDSVYHTVVRIRNYNEMQRTFSGFVKCSLENSQGVAYSGYDYESSLTRFDKELSIVPHGDFFPPPEENQGNDWDFKSLQDDLLIVKLQMKLEDCCMKTEIVQSQMSNPKHQMSNSDLHDGLQMLLYKKPLADVKLNVSGTTISAHKTILCARSPVFRRMFENDMKESINGVVDIKDFEPQIVEEFLSYLYTNTISEDISLNLNVSRELYAIADKYHVCSLQGKCRSVLLDNINEKTVCKTLKLADLHNDDILKVAASDYIGGNLSKLKNSLDFKSLVENDPRLGVHVLMSKNLE